MSDRYSRHTRPRSPTYNPARTSLPVDLSYNNHSSGSHTHHHHVVPLSRHENPRSSSTSFNSSNVPITTTTYKVKPDHRAASRTRSNTVDSRPNTHTIFTSIPKHPAVVHTSVVRPASPSTKNPYRASQEEYYTIPASSRNDKSSQHHSRYSASMDNADMNRLSRESQGHRDPNHLRIGIPSVRDIPYTTPATAPLYATTTAPAYIPTPTSSFIPTPITSYTPPASTSYTPPASTYTAPLSTPSYATTTTTTTKPRGPIYAANLVRHPDTVADDYGDDGYGYTNPKDLVQYDLNNSVPRHARKDSFDTRSSRPSSAGFVETVQSPRSYDTRERGPPPSTRGFDRIQSWETQPASVRMPVPHVAPMEPVQRPHVTPMEPIQRPVRMDPPAGYESDGPQRRPSTRRPVSMYQERDGRHPPRDEYYGSREEEMRERRPQHRHERYDDPVEQRGFGLRPERTERQDRPASRAERVERAERPASRAERPERTERIERVERSDRPERSPRNEREDDRREKKSSTHEKIATGLSIASAALGLGAMANTMKPDDRDDRDDERRRKDYGDDSRRRRDRGDKDMADSSNERRFNDSRDSSESDRPDRKERRERRHHSERESNESVGRETKERHRDRDITPPLPPRPREEDDLHQPRKEGSREEIPSNSRDVARDGKDRRSPDDDFVDLSGRNPKERLINTQNDPPRSDAATTGPTNDNHSDTADEATNRHRQPRRISGAAFNPRDTMDLKALKAALADQDSPADQEPVLASVPRQSSQEPTLGPSSKPLGRKSFTKDMSEVAELRAELNREDRGRRDPLAPTTTENKQLRVVSPPREKVEEKSEKPILLQFVRGVAPLKDAKKDGVPPDARWTKIARKLVNPAALEVGKERFEARDDFVIVLRVLSREEIQAYATATQQIRAAREEEEERAHRRARREARERRNRRREEHGRSRQHHSESDTSESYEEDRPRMLEQAPPGSNKRATFGDDILMSGGIGSGERDRVEVLR
ncbi:hypothetical protein DID88_001521 [Monilinia fructigena]|uniref:DUF8035 domain-containing protein n=1 Tax=Monilinia fructigena TaxID=38457 RepID=A0A395J2Q0_9HELO|nr:hypothetical protein DID88_001521 [Monilinia fructigena]